MFSKLDLDSRFSHHPPDGAGLTGRHEAVREHARITAEKYVAACPAGRELSLAITALEEAMFWANAAIARNPLGVPARGGE